MKAYADRLTRNNCNLTVLGKSSLIKCASIPNCPPLVLVQLSAKSSRACVYMPVCFITRHEYSLLYERLFPVSLIDISPTLLGFVFAAGQPTDSSVKFPGTWKSVHRYANLCSQLKFRPILIQSKFFVETNIWETPRRWKESYIGDGGGCQSSSKDKDD